MARRPSAQPTDGELEILNVLWTLGPSELRDVTSALNQQRQVAPTTVATMLGVMLSKGLVKRSQGRRGYRWSAKVSQKTAASGMLGRLVDRVFEGSTRRLVAHLLEEQQLSARDCEEIRRMIDSYVGQQQTG